MRFQTSVKASSVHMKFRFGCISKRPHILMDMCRHFISGSVYMIFYHPKWNFISVKVTYMKSIPALSFKRTGALIATSNEFALINFVSGSPFRFLKSKLFWLSFCLNSYEHRSGVDWTPKWDFQLNEISPVWGHFASHVNVLNNTVVDSHGKLSLLHTNDI